MSQAQSEDVKKRRALEEQQTLNPRPDKVIDRLFIQHPFFDANDLVQVKYEMLRRVQLEGWTVTEATHAFGFSRPSFYKIQRAYNQGGLEGLLPQKTGPKQGHKLSDAIMQHLAKVACENRSVRPIDLVIIVEEKFGVKIHPRSIERALYRERKKTALLKRIRQGKNRRSS